MKRGTNMKNINKIRKICTTVFVLIFIINSFISTVCALYFNVNTIKLNEKFNTFKEPLADDWNVTLVFNEPGGIYDDAFFGEKTDASDGIDSYDAPKLQYNFPPYIRAWFVSGLPSPYNELWYEYKHYPDTSKQWNLTVQWVPTDHVTPTTVTISWNSSEVDESEYNVVKLCNSTGAQLKNMLTESSYSFTCPADTPQFFYIKCQANNTAPNQPSNPSPSNGSTQIDVNANLGWICSDPDGNPLTYDVYFGTSSSPSLVQSNLSTTSYDPGSMNNNITYYWRIVAWDNWGASNSSPIWHFTTINASLGISNIILVYSNPKDINPAYGWENITATVTDDVEVSQVRINITYPDMHTENISMIHGGGDIYYYNTTFTVVGSYSYFIWAIDTNSVSKVSGIDSYTKPPNWDINMDGICNIIDVSMVSAKWLQMGAPGWIRNDINNDGIVNILDVSMVSMYWLYTWS
jgi:hypothetical protein